MRYRLSTLLIVVFIAALGFPLLRDYLESRPIPHEDYSQQQLTKHLSEGRCVLVSFHADWSFNSRNRINQMSTNVKRAVRRNDLVVMSADWTTPTPAVNQLMSQTGVDTVPSYVLFAPDGRRLPIALNEMSSEDEFLASIESVARADVN